MSASLVRKALELSSDKPASAKAEPYKSLSKKDLKIAKKKKITKKSAAKKQLKQNLKILKALEAPIGKSSSKKKKAKAVAAGDTTKSAFTEEDFAKFESEYFVTD